MNDLHSLIIKNIRAAAPDNPEIQKNIGTLDDAHLARLIFVNKNPSSKVLTRKGKHLLSIVYKAYDIELEEDTNFKFVHLQTLDTVLRLPYYVDTTKKVVTVFETEIAAMISLTRSLDGFSSMFGTNSKKSP